MKGLAPRLVWTSVRRYKWGEIIIIVNEALYVCYYKYALLNACYKCNSWHIMPLERVWLIKWAGLGCIKVDNTSTATTPVPSWQYFALITTPDRSHDGG